MPFDPDEFLGGTAVAEKPKENPFPNSVGSSSVLINPDQPSGFDPDAFLAAPTQSSGGFDPDAFVAAKDEDIHAATNEKAKQLSTQEGIDLKAHAAQFEKGTPEYELAYKAKQEYDNLPLLKRMGTLHNAVVKTGETIGHTVKTIGSIPVGALAAGANFGQTALASVEALAGVEGAEQLAQTSKAQAVLAGQGAVNSVKSLYDSAKHGIKQLGAAIKSRAGIEPENPGAKARFNERWKALVENAKNLSPDEYVRQAVEIQDDYHKTLYDGFLSEGEKAHRTAFDEDVDNIRNANKIASGQPLDTGVIASMTKIADSPISAAKAYGHGSIAGEEFQKSTAQPSELYSPEGLAASAAPPVDLAWTGAMQSAADPSLLLFAAAPELPGAATAGGLAMQGVGKAMKAPIAAINAVGGKMSKIAKAGSIGAAGALFAESALHNPAVAVKAAAAAAGAKTFQAIGEVLDVQGRELRTGIPGRFSERVAKGRATGAIDYRAEAAKLLGDTTGTGLAGALSPTMVGVNALTTDGDPQKFWEAEVTAGTFGSALSLLHSQRPMLVEALRPHLREEGAKSFDRTSELGKKSAAYMDAMPEAQRNITHEIMGAWQGMETGKGKAQIYPLSEADFQQAIVDAGGPPDAQARGYFIDSNGKILINGDESVTAKHAMAMGHTTGHESTHAALNIMRAMGDKAGPILQGVMKTAKDNLMPGGKPSKEFKAFLDEYNAGFPDSMANQRIDINDPHAIEEFLAETGGHIMANGVGDIALPKNVLDKLQDAISQKVGAIFGIDRRVTGRRTGILEDEVGGVTQELKNAMAQIVGMKLKGQIEEPPTAAPEAPAPSAPTPTPEAPVVPAPVKLTKEQKEVSKVIARNFDKSLSPDEASTIAAQAKNTDEAIQMALDLIKQKSKNEKQSIAGVGESSNASGTGDTSKGNNRPDSSGADVLSESEIQGGLNQEGKEILADIDLKRAITTERLQQAILSNGLEPNGMTPGDMIDILRELQTAKPMPVEPDRLQVKSGGKYVQFEKNAQGEWTKAEFNDEDGEFGEPVKITDPAQIADVEQRLANKKGGKAAEPVKHGDHKRLGYTAIEFPAPVAASKPLESVPIPVAAPEPSTGKLSSVSAEIPLPTNETAAKPLANTPAETAVGVVEPPASLSASPEAERAAPVVPTAQEVSDALGAADKATAGLKSKDRAIARHEALISRLPVFDARSAKLGAEPPIGLHVYIDNFGDSVVRGNLEETNPLHEEFLKSANQLGSIKAIKDIQQRVGKLTFVDYGAGKVHEGAEHSAEQRAKELADSPAEGRTDTTEQKNKAVIPFATKVTITKEGKVGIKLPFYSPDKLHSNALEVVRAAHDAGFAHGYEGSEGEINAALSRDAQIGIENHANGWSMDGSTKLRADAGEPKFFTDINGDRIDPETARQRQDVLNMAANDQGATETSRHAARVARYEKKMAEWKAGGEKGRKPREVAPISDRAKVEEQNAQALVARKDGYRNPETGEPNMLRDALSTAGFDASKLESTIENLRPELIRDVRDTPGERSIVRAKGEPVSKPPKSEYVRGGFLPKAKGERLSETPSPEKEKKGILSNRQDVESELPPKARSQEIKESLEKEGYRFDTDIGHRGNDSHPYQMVMRVERDGEEAGRMELHVYPGKNTHYQPYGEVASLFVEKSHRGKGIAELLYREAGKVLQKDKVQYLHGDVMAVAPMNLRKKVFGKHDYIGDVFDKLTESKAKKRLPNVKEDLGYGEKLSIRSKVDPNARFMPKADEGKAGDSAVPMENLAREAEEAGIHLSKPTLMGLMREDSQTVASIRQRIADKTGSVARFMPIPKTPEEFQRKADMIAQAAWLSEHQSRRGIKLDEHPDVAIDLAKQWRKDHPYEQQNNHGLPEGYLAEKPFGSEAEISPENARRSGETLIAEAEASGDKPNLADRRAAEIAPLVDASRKAGREFSPELEKLAGDEGVEHSVILGPERVLKITSPGKEGMTMRWQEGTERRSAGPTSEWATPAEYLQRIKDWNEEFGDTIRVEGVMPDKDGYRIVTSQRTIEGDRPKAHEIASELIQAGYVPMSDGLYYNPATDKLVGDLHPGNVVKNEDGTLIPIDGMIHTPTGDMKKWVMEQMRKQPGNGILSNRQDAKPQITMNERGGFNIPSDLESGATLNDLNRFMPMTRRAPEDRFGPGFHSLVEKTIEDKFPEKISEIPARTVAGRLTPGRTITDKEGKVIKEIPERKEADKEYSAQAVAEQVMAALKAAGAKQEELDWLDLPAHLADRKEVTKQDLLDIVAANNIEIEESLHSQNGESKYHIMEGRRRADWADEEGYDTEREAECEIENYAEGISDGMDYYHNVEYEPGAPVYNVEYFDDESGYWRQVQRSDESSEESDANDALETLQEENPNTSYRVNEEEGEGKWVITTQDGDEYGRYDSERQAERILDQLHADEALSYEESYAENFSVEEGEGGNTKFQQYSTEGGPNPESYAETIWSAKFKPMTKEVWTVYRNGQDMSTGWGTKEGAEGKLLDLLEQEKRKGIFDGKFEVRQETKKEPQNFRASGHWDEQNPVAHGREQMFEDAKGRSVFSSEELQSDLHQQARDARDNEVDIVAEELEKGGMERKEADAQAEKQVPKDFGYKKESLKNGRPDERKPDAPLKTTWHEFVFKKQLKRAIEKGAEVFAWTTGKTQNDRYGLEKYFGKISYNPSTKEFIAWRKGSSSADTHRTLNSDRELKSYVGKELAEKLLEKGKGFDQEAYQQAVDDFVMEYEPVEVQKANTGYSWSSGTQDLYYIKDKTTGQFLGHDFNPITNHEKDDVTGNLAMRSPEIAMDVIRDKAKKLVSQKQQIPTLEGDGLRASGQGMEGFYDKKLVNFVKQYVGKWGATVGMTNLRNATAQKGKEITRLEAEEKVRNGQEVMAQNSEEGSSYPLRKEWEIGSIPSAGKFFEVDKTGDDAHSFEITQPMKDSILGEGQAIWMPKTRRETSDAKTENKGTKSRLRSVRLPQTSQQDQQQVDSEQAPRLNIPRLSNIYAPNASDKKKRLQPQ